MDDNLKNMIVVGDRVLIRPARGEERTGVGLYLPPTAVDQKAVQGGRILATGPGTPMVAPNSLGEEPWKMPTNSGTQFVPMEARKGDYALFFRKAAVEIAFKEEKYLVVPLAAILVLVRPDDPLEELVSEVEPDSD